MKASAYIILANRHKKKSGKFSVKMRIVFQGKPKDYKTGLDLTEEEYKNAMAERPKEYIVSVRKRFKSRFFCYRILNNGIFLVSSFSS